jgi:hypothetical protein
MKPLKHGCGWHEPARYHTVIIPLSSLPGKTRPVRIRRVSGNHTGIFRTDTSMNPRSNCHASQQRDRVIHIHRCAATSQGTWYGGADLFRSPVFHKRDWMIISVHVAEEPVTGTPDNSAMHPGINREGFFANQESIPGKTR